MSRGGAVEIIGLAGDVLELLGAGLIVVGVVVATTLLAPALLGRSDRVGAPHQCKIRIARAMLLGLRVETYLETPEDPVGLEVSFATLTDGTGYPARIALEAKAKKMDVTVENSGYRRTGS